MRASNHHSPKEMEWGSPLRPDSNKNLFILAFALIVVTLGFGIVMPIIPFYMEQLGAGGTELGFLVASYAVMRMICGPIWGNLSDRWGRKPVMIIGVLGYGVTMILFGLADRLWMLFAARIGAGMLSSATSPTTMAYIGDSTSEENRSRGMGLLGAAGGIGTILGPALGGVLGGEDLSLPFFIAGGMSLLSVLLIIVLLPESLPREDRQAQDGALPSVDLRTWRQLIFSPMGSLFLLIFIITTGMMLFFGIFGLYALQRFGYGTQQVGVFFMLIGLISAIGQGALVGPLTKRLGEGWLIRTGFLLSCASLIGVMLANTYAALLLAIGFFSLASALAIPAITSLTSRWATSSQGAAMGLSNAFISLGRGIGPALGGVIFDLNWRLPFLSGAGVMLIGLAVSMSTKLEAVNVQSQP